MKQEKLPEMFRPILWSYRFEDMDIQDDKNTIIIQAVNYGTLEHLRWIVRAYSEQEVKEVLRQVPVTAIRSHVRKLVMLLFGFDDQEFNYAQRGTDN